MPMLSLLGENHRLPLFNMAKILFGLKKQNKVLTCFQLDIWLIQIWILTKHSGEKWVNVWILNLVQSHSPILDPHYNKRKQEC